MLSQFQPSPRPLGLSCFCELNWHAKFHLPKFCLSWISFQDSCMGVRKENQSNKTKPKVNQTKPSKKRPGCKWSLNVKFQLQRLCVRTGSKLYPHMGWQIGRISNHSQNGKKVFNYVLVCFGDVYLKYFYKWSHISPKITILLYKWCTFFTFWKNLMLMVKKPPVPENVSKFIGTIFPYLVSVPGLWEK